MSKGKTKQETSSITGTRNIVFSQETMNSSNSSGSDSIVFEALSANTAIAVSVSQLATHVAEKSGVNNNTDFRKGLRSSIRKYESAILNQNGTVIKAGSLRFSSTEKDFQENLKQKKINVKDVQFWISNSKEFVIQNWFMKALPQLELPLSVKSKSNYKYYRRDAKELSNSLREYVDTHK